MSNISLWTRILGLLKKPLQRYSGHRTLEDVVATVETLLRQRGDINDSAIRVVDLQPILDATLAYYTDTVAQEASSEGLAVLDFDENGTGTTWDFENGDDSVIAPITGCFSDLDEVA